ncbi:MAG: serine/threonine protein kinase, partial [Planctomycetia bacterium]|nr:serine/threonine protein kinase [Planctomycetia bacterium]
MTPPRHSPFDVESHLSALDSGQWHELEQIVERFEAVWRSGATPVLGDYLPLHDPSRSALLCELAATDLEWRLRSGLVATVESYLSEFPELGASPQAIVQLATSEFIARRRAGFAVDAAQFAQRFPSIADTLRSRLAELIVADSLDSPRSRASGIARDSTSPVVGRTEGGGPIRRSSSGIGAAPVDMPRRVGRYELVRLLGAGSFGTVHEAIDTELGRRVAVKLPRHAFGLHSEERARFVREAQNLARLSHPAIVPVLDAGSSDGTFYIVCSLVDGPTLADRLRDGPLKPRAAAQIIATVAGALDHAHRQGIVHRDVKPTNILFDASGSPWLTDFGLASCCDAEATLTVEGQLLGTPAYMAPEQAAGAAHHVDGRSDVYSLGAVLYECLTGQLPFVGSPSAVLDQIRTCEPLPPARICPRIDRDLEMICLKALEKHAADRYASAAELADDLGRYLADEPIRARQPGPAHRLVKWARRRPATAALAGATLSAMLSVTAVVWWHNLQLREALVQTDEARQQAEKLRLASESSQRQTENLLYVADLRLATNSYFNGDRVETVARLRKHMPGTAGPDRREFAWRRLWSLCNADQQTLTGHTGDVYAAQVVGDGRRLVSAGRDGTLRLWDLANDKRAQILARYPDELGFAALSPDGIALATGGDDGTIRLWNLAEGRETRHFVGHANWVTCGVISPQGDQLATSGRDNVIRLWAIPSGELLAELPGHTATVESLSYLPDGKSLVSTGNDFTLRIWDLMAKSGAVIATYPVLANCVACSHDGRRLATACSDYNVYVWDVATRSQCGRLSGHTEVVECVAFSPDDTRLASASVDGTVRVWDLEKLTQIESFLGHTSRVWSVAWLPDNATLVSAGGDGTIQLWRSGASRLERVVSLPTEILKVCFSPRRGRVWAAAKEYSVWVLDSHGPPTLLAARTEKLQYAASARNADVIAVRVGDYQARLYDSAGQPLSALIELPFRIGQFALNPAGNLLAVAGAPKGELQLYEL